TVPQVEPKEVSRVVERLRKKVAGKLPCPVYVGHGQGELTIQNSSVVLQQTVQAVLHNGDGGLLQLPVDHKVNSKWLTTPDHLTPRR
ncbi:unnamed protein product, partial [Pylaiella littoralis]